MIVALPVEIPVTVPPFVTVAEAVFDVQIPPVVAFVKTAESVVHNAKLKTLLLPTFGTSLTIIFLMALPVQVPLPTV